MMSYETSQDDFPAAHHMGVCGVICIRAHGVIVSDVSFLDYLGITSKYVNPFTYIIA